MAEKNTHSLLETIKKKLSKFDSKTEKTSKISEVASEFEYITPTAKTASLAVETEKSLNLETANNKNDLKPSDELNLDDFNEKFLEEKKEEIVAPIVQVSNFDMDSEISAAAIEERNIPAEEGSKKNIEKDIEVDSQMDEEDIEDYEDEVDFAEENDEEDEEDEEDDYTAEILASLEEEEDEEDQEDEEDE